MGRGRLPDEEVLFSLIPEDGVAVGNTSLLGLLEQRGWPEEKYWRVRDQLLSEGLIVRGKGKGGSVRRVLSEETVAAAIVPAAKVTQKRGSELALYEPLLQVLSTDWAREMSIEPDQIHFEITALQGRKPTGGTWTRPDITAVSVRTFEHLPNKYLDVWTFEAKTADCFDVTGVFEAAAHASRATRSYAILQIPEEFSAGDQDVLDRCEREAARLRVGLIIFTDPSSFKTWDTRVEAVRVDTSPEDLESLISQLSDAAKKRLARWK